MVEKKRETEPAPDEGSRKKIGDVIEQKSTKPRRKRRLHNIEGAESIIRSDIEKACKNGLKTFAILVAADANKAELFDFVERMATLLKADGQILAFRWNNRRKRNSTGIIVDINLDKNSSSE